MTNRINILSTKTLYVNTLDSFNVSKFNVMAFDFIKINTISFNKTELFNASKHWIITSKNSLEIIFNTYSLEDLKSIHFYCVGDKTAQLIESKQLNLITSALNSKTLAETIIKTYSNHIFSFIGGEMRRGELPSLLKNRQIQFTEFTIYSTSLSPNEINEHVDGVLFFSPSAVQSFMINNTLDKCIAFCIGHTTATEVKKYSHNYKVAKQQTFESVIELTQQHYT